LPDKNISQLLPFVRRNSKTQSLRAPVRRLISLICLISAKPIAKESLEFLASEK
jgi:hypothetical protein